MFYRRHEDDVLGFFARRTGRADVAADLAAESFARALEGRGAFDPERGDPRAWLFGIARHVLAASLERGRVDDAARRRLGMEPLPVGDSLVAEIEELVGGPALQAMEELPAEQRDALRGRVIEDRSYEDLAAALRCSPSVVRQRVSRGLRGLRSHLEAER